MTRTTVPTTFVIRLALPDRPGALGAVASRLGSVAADIESMTVLERREGTAVDEIEVALDPALVALAERELRAGEGVEMWCLNLAAIAPEVGVTHVVDQHDQNIGRLIAGH